MLYCFVTSNAVCQRSPPPQAEMTCTWARQNTTSGVSSSCGRCSWAARRCTLRGLGWRYPRMPAHRVAGRRTDGTCSATRWRTSIECSPAHRNRKWSWRRQRIRSQRNAETAAAVQARWCAPPNMVSCCTRSTKTTV